MSDRLKKKLQRRRQSKQSFLFAAVQRRERPYARAQNAVRARRLTRAAALALTVIAAAVLPACRKPVSDKPRVALIMKSLANEFFKTMEDGARAHHAAHVDEYDLLAQGIKDELDVSLRQPSFMCDHLGR